jgi:hypothetical protein
MTKFTFFKTMLLAITLVGSGSLSAETATLTINRSSFPSGSLTYNVTDNWSSNTSKGDLISGEGDIYSSSNQTTLQSKNTGVSTMYHNTVSIPGSITNIILDCASGTTRTYTVYVNKTTPITSTTGGTSKGTIAPVAAASANLTLDKSEDWRYFWLDLAGGASYLNSITIEYEVAASSTAAVTPSITATGNQKATDNFYNTASITLSSSTDGASIYYTTNGDVPTTSSTLYSAPFDITSTTTIKAIAVKSGLDNSTVSEKMITITVSTPVATAASSISSSGFTANWDAVPAATDYELTVVSRTISGTPAADLFFSEYIEGSSYNKAIEIYNGTGVAVDLSSYTVELYGNGATDAGTTLSLTGTLANNDVYVIYNSSANTAIKDAGDVSSTVTYFNGNDAMVLKKSDTILDIIGRIGEDPGTAWTAAGGGFSTAEKTLVRKSTVVAGVSVNPSAGFPTLETEWDLYDQDAASNLGAHSFAAMTVTENPVAGSPFTVAGANSKVITGLAANTSYYYKLTAKNGSAVSAVSNEISVTTDTTTALSTLTQDLQLRILNGNIIFNTTAGKLVDVYNNLGQRVSTTITTEGSNTIPARVRGVVFVKIGSEILKLIVE